MSLAAYTPRDATPERTLRLVSSKPSSRKDSSEVDDFWTRRTAFTYVLAYDAGHTIALEDQRRVTEALRKYAETLLSLIFKGTMIYYAVNLRRILNFQRPQYLADMNHDISRALQAKTTTMSLDTDRELTIELQQAITEALSWSRHIVRAISFKGGVVRYAVTLSDIDKEYHETVLKAIKGDIIVASRIGEWN